MNEAPLIEQGQFDSEAVAKRFTDMAERIRLNVNSSFGGAFVIIPPAGGDGPVETLILDGKQNTAQFYSLVRTAADLALKAIDDNQRNSAFGRR